jgi:hypothetical protein
MTTPTITPSNANSSTVTGPDLVPHQHNFNSVVGLRFGEDGRVEPVYDSADVKANGQVIALYNAATPKAGFSPSAVPLVTVQDAVQDNDGDNSDGAAQASQFLAAGKINQQEYELITAEIKPTGTGIAPVASLKGNTIVVTGDAFTYDTVLTPYGTTLATMIKDVAFPRTIAQLGQGTVTAAQAVNNLANLALNVWEPVKRQYPRAIMTNSFRQGSGSSQHSSGQACDIQIRGLNSSAYFDVAVWMSKNIPYDQLLLEYLPGKTVWIHVSYAIPGLPTGGRSVLLAKGKASTLATLNGASGGKFVPNLHADIIANAGINRVVAA